MGDPVLTNSFLDVLHAAYSHICINIGRYDTFTFECLHIHVVILLAAHVFIDINNTSRCSIFLLDFIEDTNLDRYRYVDV